MAQEDMNITISPEMLQEIIRVASETAIEKYQREAEKSRKAVRDKRLHNTKLLLQNYHCFVEHSKSAVYEASQLSEDDDFEELMEELMSQTDGRVRVPVVRSIQESAAHTRIIVQHIDRKLYVLNNQTVGVMRRGRVWVRLATGAAPAYGDALHMIVEGDEAGCFAKEGGIAIPGRFIGAASNGVAPVELYGVPAASGADGHAASTDDAKPTV